MTRKVTASGHPRPYLIRYQGVLTRAARKVPRRKTRLSQLIPGLVEVASVTCSPCAVRPQSGPASPVILTVPPAAAGPGAREGALEDTSEMAICRPTGGTGTLPNISR